MSEGGGSEDRERPDPIERHSEYSEFTKIYIVCKGTTDAPAAEIGKIGQNTWALLSGVKGGCS